MQHTIQKLDWDSDFFNFNVGKLYGQLHNEADLVKIEKLVLGQNLQLVYYSSTAELPISKINSHKLDIILADTKTTFVKTINKNLEIHPNIKSLEKDTIFKEKLIELAVQSGVYSRFNVDKRITNEKFEEMYKLWIINSLNGKIAQHVLGYVEDSQLLGFVTLGEKNNRADIGIIAVDHQNRGQGIGKILMNSAEKWFGNIDNQTIQVVTQGTNTPACKLYESCGYQIDTVEYLYHIWQH